MRQSESRRGSRRSWCSPPPGRVLGLLPATGIVCETLELQAGDTFVLFTDGVSEAFAADEELFGEARLLAEVQALAGRGRAATTAGVLESVRRHAAGAQQSDDITVVSVHYAGPVATHPGEVGATQRSTGFRMPSESTPPDELVPTPGLSSRFGS